MNSVKTYITSNLDFEFTDDQTLIMRDFETSELDTRVELKYLDDLSIRSEEIFGNSEVLI